VISADLDKLDIFGTDYLFLLLDSRLREVRFRAYVTDVLGHLAGIPEHWAASAYNIPPRENDRRDQQSEEPDTLSTSDITASIIDGLAAILERSENV
jgi:hypothetical protein